MSLLQQAKQVTKKQKTTHFFSKEEIELALGWVRNEISMMQVQKVMNIPHATQVYPFIARAMRQYYSNELKTV